jgi:hypothetical protein
MHTLVLTDHLVPQVGLETVKKLHISDNIPRTVTVHTDSRITLHSHKNTKNYNSYKKIRKKAIALEKRNWTIIFSWIKAPSAQ